MPKDLRLADAAEAAVRRGEAGALDHPEQMPAYTLQHLAFVFMGDRAPAVQDPRQVVDLLEAYRTRIHPHLPDHDGTFGRRLNETRARLEAMGEAAEIPAAVFEQHLETNGWTSLGSFGPNLNGWIRRRSGRSSPGTVTCLVPLEGPTWDSAIGAWRYDRSQRAWDALVAIAAAEKKAPLAVLAELRQTHEAVAQHMPVRTAEVVGTAAPARPARRAASVALGEPEADLIGDDDLLADQSLTPPPAHERDAGLQRGL